MENETTAQQKYTFRNGGSRSLARPETSFSGLQKTADVGINLTVLFLFTYLQGVNISAQYEILMALAGLLTLLYYQNFGVYEKPLDAVGVFTRLAKAWGAVVVSLMFLAFITKTSIYFSRQAILSWIAMTFFLQFFAHIFVSKALIKYREKTDWKEPAVLVGAGDLGKYLTGNINNDLWLPVKIIGVADDDESVLAAWTMPEVKVIGGLRDIPKFIDDNSVRSVYIALPLNSSGTVERLYVDLLATNLDVSWVPDVFGMTLINPNIKEIAGMPVFALSETPLIGSRAVAKSVLDKTIAVLTLIVASPIMIAATIAIKLTSPGPVLFKQIRHGWNGKEIEVWKFRSMLIHEEDEGVVSQATEDDPRVTAVGRFLRRSSIDELPQLFNVLQGTMSLVGPRPHAVEHNNYYSELIHTYFARHKIKPGMTGLAQVQGYRGETKTLEKMKKRVECDLEYINNWSIALDLKILFKTIFVLFSKSAY